MKLLCYLSFLFILFSFVGCNKKTPHEKVGVGMTYNEVEAILNKPIAISRGVNELYVDLDKIPYKTLKRLNLATIGNEKDSTRWFALHKIRTIGNLIYVTWIYNKASKDTFYIDFKTFKEIKDTQTINSTNYYLGNRKVSQLEYLKSDGYEYRLQDNSLVNKSLYYDYKKSKLYRLPPPQKIRKRIDHKKATSVSTEVVDTHSNDREYYLVMYKYCVIFDASSGRVTNSGFFPFSISQLKPNKSKLDIKKTPPSVSVQF